MTLDTSAFLAVLLASTGFSQTEAAALLQVDGRTVRRWIEGTRPTPKVAIERLRAHGPTPSINRAGDHHGNGRPAVLLLYRRDRDVPPLDRFEDRGLPPCPGPSGV
jgi:hypothetical protein